MAIVNDQTFANNFDPGNPPPLPFDAEVIPLVLNDANDDGIITADGDIVNGSLVTAVYNGDVITINGVDITGATIYTEDGGRYFTPTDNTILTDSTITNVTWVPNSTQLTLQSLGPACLTKGTLVETKTGMIPVEDLKIDDLVRTEDNGFQPIRWIGHRTVDGTGEFAPICLTKGSFGNSRDLLVSPEHRMLVTGWKCELLFGQEEVLCAAKHLAYNSDTIYHAPCEEVTYFHVMFDAHEIIFAEGAATESFFMGDEVAKSDRETFLELVSLFPERAAPAILDTVLPARMLLKRFEAQSLQTL